MKTNMLIMAAMLIGLAGFAQKSEIKAAEKAMKGGDAATAKASLESAAGAIAGADERVQAEYYFLRGQVYSDLAKKGDMSAFGESVDSYKKVVSLEEASGKVKYSEDAQIQMSSLANDLVNAAGEDQTAS